MLPFKVKVFVRDSDDYLLTISRTMGRRHVKRQLGQRQLKRQRQLKCQGQVKRQVFDQYHC